MSRGDIGATWCDLGWFGSVISLTCLHCDLSDWLGLPGLLGLPDLFGLLEYPDLLAGCTGSFPVTRLIRFSDVSDPVMVISS